MFIYRMSIQTNPPDYPGSEDDEAKKFFSITLTKTVFFYEGKLLLMYKNVPRRSIFSS